MQIINLINKDKGDIVYDIINFSDGEKHIKFITEINRKDSVKVICRITSMDELFILMQVGDILNRMEVEWALVITYLMGMRMDRVMSFNEAFSLKIVAKTINDMHPDAVFIVEPHSDRTLKLINNSTPLMNRFAEAAMTDPEHNYMIVFPDAGAKLRYGEALENKMPMMTCHKKRDPATGKLSGFGIDNPEVLNEYPECNAFFVIDDLCDGGGTFCGIADQLKELRPDFHRTLAITHAVAARGIYKVMDYYNDLFITNSYADWGNDQFVASNSDRIFVLDTEKYYFNA
jgi:ribose-phosphate pyrophosphokinase